MRSKCLELVSDPFVFTISNNKICSNIKMKNTDNKTVFVNLIGRVVDLQTFKYLVKKKNVCRTRTCPGKRIT